MDPLIVVASGVVVAGGMAATLMCREYFSWSLAMGARDAAVTDSVSDQVVNDTAPGT